MDGGLSWAGALLSFYCKCSDYYVSVLKDLIDQNKINLKQFNGQGSTFLMTLVRKAPSVDFISFFIDSCEGVKETINIVSPISGHNALSIAYQRNKYEIAKVLQDNGAVLENVDGLVLLEMLYLSQRDIINYHVDKGLRFKLSEKTCNQGKLTEKARRFISKIFSDNLSIWDEPLQQQKIEILSKMGFDFNLTIRPLINSALSRAIEAEAGLLWDPDFKSSGKVPSIIDLLKQMLKTQKIDINYQDHKGRTALFYALDNLELTKLLIQHGADVSVRSKDGTTVFEQTGHLMPTRPIAAAVIDILKFGKFLQSLCSGENFVPQDAEKLMVSIH